MFGNRKVYGASRLDKCPFCEKTALTKNAQGIPVCIDHKHKEIGNLKCSCGKWLDLKSGKFGSYFNCINCGNISFNKALEMNPKIEKKDENNTKQAQAKPTYKTETLRNFQIEQSPNASSRIDSKFLACSRTAGSENKSVVLDKEDIKKEKKEITIRSDELDFYY